MSSDRDVTRIVRSWLEEGVTQLPDRVLDSVLDQVPATPQRRAWWPAWRFPNVNATLKFGLAAVIVVVVALLGYNYIVGQNIGGPSVDDPSPTPMATPIPLRDGTLPAGTYTTLPFAGANVMGICMGQVGCTESPEDDSIRVTFTLPDGWSGLGGAIVPTVEEYSPPGGASMHFMRGGWLHSEPCPQRRPVTPDIPTGTRVDEFVTALVDHPDLDVTSPVEVTLAGYSGQYLELQAPANIGTDPTSPGPGECGGYFVWEPGIYAQGPNHLWHIWVLDVDGVRVVVRMDTHPGTSAQVQADLEAIVDSIQIAP